MAKRDTKKTAKFSVRSQEWSLDIAPHKSTKKAKAKERQEGRKEARDFDMSGIGFGLKEE